MWIKVQDIPRSQCIDISFQYIQLVVTFWVCILIFDAIIPNKIYFRELAFLILTFPLFFSIKMHVFAVHCAVMSPLSVHYH